METAVFKLAHRRGDRNIRHTRELKSLLSELKSMGLEVFWPYGTNPENFVPLEIIVIGQVTKGLSEKDKRIPIENILNKYKSLNYFVVKNIYYKQ